MEILERRPSWNCMECLEFEKGIESRTVGPVKASLNKREAHSDCSPGNEKIRDVLVICIKHLSLCAEVGLLSSSLFPYPVSEFLGD